MKLTLNPHGLLATYYREFYQTTKLPNNLCSYFWKLVIGIICFPICYPAMAINYAQNPIRYDKEDNSWSGGGDIPTAIGGLLNLLILLIGLGFSHIVYGNITGYFSLGKLYINGIIGTICVIALIAITAFMVYGVYLLVEYIQERKQNNHESISQEEYNKREVIRQEILKQKELKRQKSLWYLTKKMFFAWKEKNCPIIEWESVNQNQK